MERDWEGALRVDPELMAKHASNYNLVSRQIKMNKSWNPSLYKNFGEMNYKKWQVDVKNLLFNQDDRKILFVVDTIGNSGKSTFGKILRAKEDNVIYQSILGNAQDRAYMTAKQVIELPEDKRPVFVFDIPRSCPQQFWPLQFIENLKDGNITSVKYQGVIIDMCWSQVCILCNETPIITNDKLSKDRYEIYNIS